MRRFLKRIFLELQIFRSRAMCIAVLSAAFSLILCVAAVKVNAVMIHDGNSQILAFTMKEDPDEILKENGIITQYGDEVDFSSLGGKVSEIDIKRGFPVTIIADGSVSTITMTGGTCQDALDKAGMIIADDDLINVPLTEDISGETRIEINRVLFETVTEQQEIPYEVSTKETSLLKKGRVKVLSEGQNGVKTTEKVQKVVDGQVVQTDVLSEEVTAQPVEQQLLVGMSSATPVSQLEPSDGLLLDESGRPANYNWVMQNAVATAYSARAGARTASGRQAIVGHVAVNPAEIPYGSKLYITSADGKFVYGYAIAADTGTALRDGIVDVDLFFGSYLESCLFGKQRVNIYVLN